MKPVTDRFKRGRIWAYAPRNPMQITNRAGEQLSGDALYQHQKHLRATASISPAPTIVAVHLSITANMGAVLRLADAAGSPQVIFIQDTAPSLTQVRRTARNSDNLVPWQVTTEAAFLSQSQSLLPLVAIELTTTSTNIFESALPDLCTFVIGNEHHGIPTEILAHCDTAAHIPMFGTNGSMNVTHALGIALYEWRRRHPR